MATSPFKDPSNKKLIYMIWPYYTLESVMMAITVNAWCYQNLHRPSLSAQTLHSVISVS